MTDYLASARSKLDRANEHLKYIDKEILAWRDTNPYRFILEPNSDSTEWVLWLELTSPSHFPRWATMLGDGLQNLRSCLDHAIYGIAFSRSTPKLPKNWRGLYFPICDSPSRFPDSLALIGDLRHDASLVALIEGLQPYNRGKQDWAPPLTVLKDLNDRDKHREIIVTLGGLARLELQATNIPPNVIYRTRESFSTPLDQRTELWRIQLSEPVPNMGFEAQAAAFPAARYTLELKAINADRIGIDFLLEYCRDEVTFCLGELERFA